MKRNSIKAAFLALLMAGCGQSESASVACLPKGHVQQQSSSAGPIKLEKAPRATLFLDLSLSMVSFLNARKPDGLQEPLGYAGSFQFGALVRRLPPILKQSTQRFEIAGFSHLPNRGADNRLRPLYGITEDQFRELTATECFINLPKGKRPDTCHSLYKGNGRTDFSGLFPDVEARVANGELVTIVSDLLTYNSGQLGDYNDVAGPLSALVRKGYAVAMLSAAVGYNGTVHDVPGPKIRLAARTPFHILVIGSSAQVATVLKNIDEDTGLRSFRQSQSKFWHAVLFDSHAGAALALGAPEVGPLPQRGVWTTGSGLVTTAGFAGQFVVGRPESDGANRAIRVNWPITASNPLIPVEYSIQPESEVWVHTSGGTRCEDGWQSLNDAALHPTAATAELTSASAQVQQTLFANGVPFQMTPRTTYLWRLGWQQAEARRAAAEDEFLQSWSTNATNLPDLRMQYARGGGGAIFPTFDFEALYLDLWQAAYGAGAKSPHLLRTSTYVAAVLQ